MSLCSAYVHNYVTKINLEWSKWSNENAQCHIVMHIESNYKNSNPWENQIFPLIHRETGERVWHTYKNGSSGAFSINMMMVWTGGGGVKVEETWNWSQCNNLWNVTYKIRRMCVCVCSSHFNIWLLQIFCVHVDVCVRVFACVCVCVCLS